MDLNGRTEKWMNGKMDRRTAEHVPNYIPPHLAGDNLQRGHVLSTHSRKNQEVESSIFWPTIAVYALFGPVP